MKRNYRDRQFSVLGDSISTFEGVVPKGYSVYYERENRIRTGVVAPELTWWHKVVSALGGRILKNDSWSGCRVSRLHGSKKQFPSACSSERTSRLHTGDSNPDVIVVFLGTNDWFYKNPLGNGFHLLRGKGHDDTEFLTAYTIDEASGEVTFDSAVLIDFDSSELKDESKATIDEFISVYESVVLSGNYASRIDAIMFEGHTDSSGDFDYNMSLSEKRAKAVMDYCIDSNGLTGEQKTALRKIAKSKGYSYADLVYDENGKEDAEATRRVAIKFYLR